MEKHAQMAELLLWMDEEIRKLAQFRLDSWDGRMFHVVWHPDDWRIGWVAGEGETLFDALHHLREAVERHRNPEDPQ